MPDALFAGGFSEAQWEHLGRCGFALALQIVRNREDAADVVQDSLHAAIRKAGMFDSRRGSQRAWFLKIVRNRCLDAIRKRNRRSERPLETAAPAVSAESRPEVAAERKETVEFVRRELMGMPEEQREIILLRDYHDLSYAEVASVLDIPVGTVMSRLHRARQELRSRMKKYG